MWLDLAASLKGTGKASPQLKRICGMQGMTLGREEIAQFENG